MRINPLRLISIWFMTILITIILTAMVVNAAGEDPKAVQYEVITYEDYMNRYEASESPRNDFKVEDEEQVEQHRTIAKAGQSKSETYKVTAYCPCEICCGEWSDGFTYSGDLAHEGATIAADLSKLPLGTVVEIEGLGQRVVQDIGGVINGNEIDLFFYSHQAALEFGVQYLEVTMVNEE